MYKKSFETSHRTRKNPLPFYQTNIGISREKFKGIVRKRQVQFEFLRKSKNWAKGGKKQLSASLEKRQEADFIWLARCVSLPNLYFFYTRFLQLTPCWRLQSSERSQALITQRDLWTSSQTFILSVQQRLEVTQASDWGRPMMLNCASYLSVYV